MNDTSLKSRLLQLTDLRYRRLSELVKILSSENNPLSGILQCHLFVESLLEELIRFSLGKNAEAILSAHLNFNQKLAIVAKLELYNNWPLMPDYVIASLRRLNALRNKLAHRYGYDITQNEIRELFVGIESELPYNDILDLGIETAISRYAAFIFGHMLPKYESDTEV